MKPRTELVVVSCVLLIGACTTPATTRNESAPEAGPRFAHGGPDAEEYGASLGYPKGERGTFLRVSSLVGSLSHLDELFEGRVIAKAVTPSRLARAASEPAIPWELGIRHGSSRVSGACSRCSGFTVSRSSSIRNPAWSW